MVNGGSYWFGMWWQEIWFVNSDGERTMNGHHRDLDNDWLVAEGREGRVRKWWSGCRLVERDWGVMNGIRDRGMS